MVGTLIICFCKLGYKNASKATTPWVLSDAFIKSVWSGLIKPYNYDKINGMARADRAMIIAPIAAILFLLFQLCLAKLNRYIKTQSARKNIIVFNYSSCLSGIGEVFVRVPVRCTTNSTCVFIFASLNLLFQLYFSHSWMVAKYLAA